MQGDCCRTDADTITWILVPGYYYACVFGVVFHHPNKYDMLMVIIDSYFLRVRFCVYQTLAYWYDHLGAFDCTPRW